MVSHLSNTRITDEQFSQWEAWAETAELDQKCYNCKDSGSWRCPGPTTGTCWYPEPLLEAMILLVAEVKRLRVGSSEAQEDPEGLGVDWDAWGASAGFLKQQDLKPPVKCTCSRCTGLTDIEALYYERERKRKVAPKSFVTGEQTTDHLDVERSRRLCELGAWEQRPLRAGDWTYPMEDLLSSENPEELLQELLVTLNPGGYVVQVAGMFTHRRLVNPDAESDEDAYMSFTRQEIGGWETKRLTFLPRLQDLTDRLTQACVDAETGGWRLKWGMWIGDSAFWVDVFGVEPQNSTPAITVSAPSLLNAIADALIAVLEAAADSYFGDDGDEWRV